eukprot:m.783715 g.783715  ORF g.783715 m.783715 type:complete len:135 (-) comp23295_c0_seq2:2831-3235(-)
MHESTLKHEQRIKMILAVSSDRSDVPPAFGDNYYNQKLLNIAFDYADSEKKGWLAKSDVDIAATWLLGHSLLEIELKEFMLDASAVQPQPGEHIPPAPGESLNRQQFCTFDLHEVEKRHCHKLFTRTPKFWCNI